MIDHTELQGQVDVHRHSGELAAIEAVQIKSDAQIAEETKSGREIVLQNGTHTITRHQVRVGQPHLRMARVAEVIGHGSAQAKVRPRCESHVIFRQSIEVQHIIGEQLGEEGVQIVKEQYTLTQVDPSGAFIYYGNSDWSVEAGFLYADEASASETSPALVMNYTIKEGVPDGAVYLSAFDFQQMIAYAFRNEISTNELADWFENADDPADIFTLPGYTLNILKSGGQIQYAVLPPASQIPQVQDMAP